MSRRVDQASEMIAVQADCSIEDAVEIMEARAAATGRSLEDIAEAVVARAYPRWNHASRGTSDK